MKNKFLIILCFSFICCKVYKNTKSIAIEINGHTSYKLSINDTQNRINKELYKLYKDPKTKEDSLSIKKIIENSSKILKKYKDATIDVNYYFINDTIKISSLEEETIFIPKSFIKYKEWKRNGKKRKHIFKGDSIYNNWEITYKIEVDKNDKKRIIDIEGYKTKITETRKGLYGTYTNVSEIYVSDKYNFPFEFYDFLKLKKKINRKGLILECKSYLKESPDLYNLYTLQKVNTKKQDKKLISLSNF